jgi:hypothetical protein
MTDAASRAHREDLAWFFTEAEHASGLESSWPALVAIAVSGRGGDPEGWVNDRRFRLGPAARTAISRARDVRAALLSLSDRQRNVLIAAHGAVDWKTHLDAVYGWGTGQTVARKLGDLFGVALLTPAVEQGFLEASAPVDAARDGKPLHRPREGATPRGAPVRMTKRCATPEGWLVHVCRTDPTTLAVVQEQASALLAEAEVAYARARGSALDVDRGGAGEAHGERR